MSAALFARNLARCGKPVIIQARQELIINGVSEEVFTDVLETRATVKTLRGVSVFDSTNTERAATHHFCINYVADPVITSENWLFFKGKRVRILDVENCCEDDRTLKLFCTERGDDGSVINGA